jgi:hypothetical protein
MKLYEAIIHGGNKTVEQIRALSDFDLDDSDVENILKFNQTIEGMKAIVTDDFYGYGYLFVDSEDKEKPKEAFYLMEQDSMFGTYINQREEFGRDWDNGEYEPDGCMTLSKAQVEIIRELEATHG